MPQRAEVVVVGAGVTGLSVAFFLASAGADVLVVERSGIGAGASGIQPGGVRQQWGTAVNCVLAREAVDFYAHLDQHLGRRVGATLERCGYLFGAAGDATLDALRANVALQNRFEIPSRLVSADEAAQLVPGLDASRLVGAAWCGDDGYFDKPQSVVEAFGAAAQDRGARLQIADVGAIERDGVDWRLETSAGPVSAAQVVVAAGTETSALVSGHGVSLPIEAEARHLFLSEPVAERLVEPLVVIGEWRFAAKQLANGRVLTSDLAAVGDPEIHRDEWRRTVADGIEAFLPILSFVPLPILATGDYDVTPDHQPLVGAAGGGDGLWVAAGYSGHGFMLAPAISQRLAAAVLAGVPAAPIAEFSVDRFVAHDVVPAESQVV